MRSLSSGDFTRGFGGGLDGVQNAPKTKSSINLNDLAKANASDNIPSTPQATSPIVEEVKEVKQDTQIKNETKPVKKSKGSEISSTASRDRRNKLIISILSIVIGLVWIAVLIMGLVEFQKPGHNCHLYSQGTAIEKCDILVDNKTYDEWNTPNGLGILKTLNTTVDLNIKQSGDYKIRFKVEVFKNKQEVSDAVDVIYNELFSAERDEEGDIWFSYTISSEPIKLQLLSGINFWGTLNEDKLNGLTSQNMKIDIYIEVNYN